MNDDIKAFLREEAIKRFLAYVKVDTGASEESGAHPSTPGQWDLARQLADELKALGLTGVTVSDYCYVYGTLPASAGSSATPLSLVSHMDTSPSESGRNVTPVIHKNYDGGVITFCDNPDLTLSPKDSPELSHFIGDAIITASGQTLLGADDKAGVAEIMAVLAAFKKYPGLPRPELRIVFTPDEEIGQGVDHIEMDRLGKYAYTVDGSMVGEYEGECFDAFGATLTFSGSNVHPGYAKNRMVNAAAIAARFISALPEAQAPENTEAREGFYHLTHLSGNENTATAKLIIRDFDGKINRERLAYLDLLKAAFEKRYSGLSIELTVKDQYNNMKEVLDQHPEVMERAKQAIALAGLAPICQPIRGGTDGARLSFMGVPTPNLFAGGLLFHSKKEWIAAGALQKSCEVLIHLCALSA